jgi:thioester reductase-like protein
MLDELPMTPSGKLNRRALPAPQLELSLEGRYMPPEGETEEGLARIWKDVLRVTRVGRDDNFFELGGHSLLVLKLLFSINESFACELKVTDVYKYPTIRELAMTIAGASVASAAVNLQREAILTDEIVALNGHRRTRAQTILLTGASGFVGRFLLAHLLDETDATICCLVRAPSTHEATTRLRLSLLKWDLWREDMEHRIAVVAGDLRLPALGIDAATHRWLSEDVDSIFHCGSSMNHLETYAMAKPANVEGARQLLKLATSGRPKLLNYISTLGVFAPSTTQAMRLVNEQTSIDHETHFTSSGYVASKWVAEKIFMTARERGIPCNIFRLGFTWSDAERGRYDELQHGYRFLKSCLLSGYGIMDYRYDAVPLPVDYAARAIVGLANRHPDGGRMFHIASSRRMDEGMFERCNRVAETSLELISYYEWIGEMKRLHRAGQSLPAAPLIQSAFSLDESAFHAQQSDLRMHRVQAECTQTEQELARAGVSPPGSFDDVLRLTVEYMLRNDPELRDGATARAQLAQMRPEGKARPVWIRTGL